MSENKQFKLFRSAAKVILEARSAKGSRQAGESFSIQHGSTELVEVHT
jgi:hypothetical protein